MKELEIIIETDGTTRIHMKGIEGSDCLNETRPLEEALGEICDRSYTTEFYEGSPSLLQEDSIPREKKER